MARIGRVYIILNCCVENLKSLAQLGFSSLV